MSVPVRLEYADNGSVLVAEFLCNGDPNLLESGGQGWFAVSGELDWLCGWRLQVQCPITEPKKDYGYRSPPAGKEVYKFEEYGDGLYGELSVDERKIRVRFPIPDCLDPPRKSFKWGGPILIDGKVFNCELKLVLRPRAGGSARRRPATPDCAGGIEFLSSKGAGDKVIGFVRDSETVRGRRDRIDAYIREHAPTVGSPYRDSRGRLIQRLDSGFLHVTMEAAEYVDAHPSRADCA
jgi:hypothetical protein